VAEQPPKLQLRSTTNGTSWQLNNVSTNNVTFVDVQDSDARLGQTIFASNSTDVSNNRNWNFSGAGLVKTWWGGTSTNWSTGANWDQGTPTAADSALIVSTAAVMPTLTSAVTISSLTINSAATLTLNGYNFTLSSFTNSGSVVIMGTEPVTTAPNNLAYSSVT